MKNSTIHIALLDDHKIFREGVELIITANECFKVNYSGEDAKEYLGLLRKGISPPDIVIVDNAMPNMTGMEFTQLITKEYPKIEVIVLSMHVSNQLLMEAFEFGAKAYVDKGSGGKELMKAIDAVVNDVLYLPPNLEPIKEDLDKQVKSNSKKLQYVINGERYTENDIEIIRSFCEGKSNQQIADEHNKSLRTIEWYKSKILEKTSSSNSVELFRFALKNGLVLIS